MTGYLVEECQAAIRLKDAASVYLVVVYLYFEKLAYHRLKVFYGNTYDTASL